jgi:tRNA pseudouridine55 synthase
VIYIATAVSQLLHMDFQAGEVLLIDKPKGWSSFDVVRKVRSLIKTKKVGHAGTLDPLATGLLILCTGGMTKAIDKIQALEKEYLVEFRLGATTPSYDAEFPPENPQDCSHLTMEMIHQAIQKFKGAISQSPPQFSAVKVAGKRAYESARSGKLVDIKPRTITVYSYDLLEFRAPDWVRAQIRCSKGTYIRSLVHDLGQILGVGAYILELRRTRIGEHCVEDAFSIEGFRETMAAAPSTESGK